MTPPVSRRSPRAATTPRRTFLTPRGRGVLVGAIWLLGIGGVCYGLARLEPYAQRFSPGETRLEFASLPTWLSDPNWEHVLRDVQGSVPDFGATTAIYDEAVCEWVGWHVGRSPWVARLERVSKSADRRVTVHAEFRKPFTFVERDGRAYLIDRAGVRLPIERADVDSTQWIVLRGMQASAPPVGQAWPGEDVQAGLKLVDFLYRAEADGNLPVRRFIRGVDVSNHKRRKEPLAGELRIALVQRGALAHWGLPPGEEFGVEASAERKLATLCEESTVRGWIQSGESIDLRDPVRGRIYPR